jgi:hypothetical protein
MALVMYLIGGLAVVVGIVGFFGNAGESGPAAMALGSVISGILFLGFGSIIDTLHKIERHLRPPEEKAKSHSLAEEWRRAGVLKDPTKDPSA